MLIVPEPTLPAHDVTARGDRSRGVARTNSVRGATRPSRILLRHCRDPAAVLFTPRCTPPRSTCSESLFRISPNGYMCAASISCFSEHLRFVGACSGLPPVLVSGSPCQQCVSTSGSTGTVFWAKTVMRAERGVVVSLCVSVSLPARCIIDSAFPIDTVPLKPRFIVRANHCRRYVLIVKTALFIGSMLWFPRLLFQIVLDSSLGTPGDLPGWNSLPAPVPIVLSRSMELRVRVGLSLDG